MKKITNSKSVRTIFYCLFVPAIFFIACQTDETTDRIENSATNSAFLRNGNCEEDCIIEGGPYFESTDSKTVTWGGPQQNNFSKTVDITYYNTTTHFVLEVKSTHAWGDLLIKMPGEDWVGVLNYFSYNGQNNDGYSVYSQPLTSGWRACNIIDFDFKVTGHNTPVTFDVNYNLIGICDDGCETSFMGEAISCGATREAIYTFTADANQPYIKIQGGLTNFTGENAEITVSSANLTYTQSTPGGSSNRIIKVEGPVSECETITIHVRWNSSNNGGIITGSWSVTNGNGVELAPAVIGLQCD